MLDDVLTIYVNARLLRMDSAVFLLLGDADDDWVARQPGRDVGPWMQTRILFGLPAHSLAHPVLIKRVIAERGTELNALSLFSWLEDQFMVEPRAEIFGVTPFGEEPFLFLRDIDLDRPPQCCVVNEPAAAASSGHPLLLLAGFIWVDGRVDHGVHTVVQDEAALSGLALTLPEHLGPIVENLRIEVAAGFGLRQVMKRLRKQLHPDLAHFVDGWRVLSCAVPLAHIGRHDAAPTDAFIVMPLLPPPPPKQLSPKKRA